MHLGGCQAIAGVVPDLTALGKALGNGWTTAARRTITLLEQGGIARLNRLGAQLRDGLTRAIADTGVTANVTGIGSGWIVNWRAEPPVTFRQAVDADTARAEAFRLAMLDAGVLLPPYPLTDNRMCVAFADDDVDHTIDAARRAFAAVA